MVGRKKILFVTYGSGHARMIIPVLKELEAYPDIEYQVMALTLGGPVMASEGYDYIGYKDFLREEDTQAHQWGQTLAKKFHQPESGIAEEEAIAYLGLSYWDLIQRLGEDEAEKQWQKLGRHAFCQLSVFERVLDQIQPDLVVATNSPRSERAAVEVANARDIPTLCMIDLFGIYHFHTVTSKYIAVLCAHTIENMQKEGVDRPTEAFFVTGNPAFDHAFDYRGPIDTAYRREHFPTIEEDAKLVLWADMHAYWNFETKEMYTRTDADIVEVLDGLADAVEQAGGQLLIRPHPSQQRKVYDDWMQSRNQPFIHYAGAIPLYPLLKACDVIASYGSTVTVEALLMQRKVVQLKYFKDFTDMPIGQWGWTWLAENIEDLKRCMHEAFHDEAKSAQMFARVEEELPQQRAAPKMAALIADLIASESASIAHVK